MKFIGVINGWACVPKLWRELLWPPLQIQRELTVRVDENGELRLLETPMTYSVQILGVVLLFELSRWMSA